MFTVMRTWRVPTADWDHGSLQHSPAQPHHTTTHTETRRLITADLKKPSTRPLCGKQGAKKSYAKATGDEEELERLQAEDEGLLSGISDLKDDVCGYFKLTRKQRLYGFAYSVIAGVILSVVGVLFLAGTPKRNIPMFAVCYSLGTVSSICSSMFLFGPCYQIKKMFQATRWVAALVMLASVGLTIYFAVIRPAYTDEDPKIGLVVVLVCVQFAAVVWYGLSYIPFARKMVTSCFTKMVGL